MSFSCCSDESADNASGEALSEGERDSGEQLPRLRGGDAAGVEADNVTAGGGHGRLRLVGSAVCVSQSA